MCWIHRCVGSIAGHIRVSVLQLAPRRPRRPSGCGAVDRRRFPFFALLTGTAVLLQEIQQLEQHGIWVAKLGEQQTTGFRVWRSSCYISPLEQNYWRIMSLARNRQKEGGGWEARLSCYLFSFFGSRKSSDMASWGKIPRVDRQH